MNNTRMQTIKMNPPDEKPCIHIDFDKENNEKGPKFKVGDHVEV